MNFCLSRHSLIWFKFVISFPVEYNYLNCYIVLSSVVHFATCNLCHLIVKEEYLLTWGILQLSKYRFWQVSTIVFFYDFYQKKQGFQLFSIVFFFFHFHLSSIFYFDYLLSHFCFILTRYISIILTDRRQRCLLTSESRHGRCQSL